MDIARLVADQLGLPKDVEVRIGEPTLNENFLQSFDFLTDDQHYKVFFVDEDVDDEGQLLPTEQEHVVPLAAFYNARYLHELLLYERAEDIKAGHLATAFSIVDGHKQHSIFTLKTVQGQDADHAYSLSLEQVLTVAEELSRLHALRSFDASAGARQAIDENYAIIKAARLAAITKNVQNIGDLVPRHGALFHAPNEIERKVHDIYIGQEEFTEYVDSLGRLGNGTLGTTVLCHGNLTANDIHFDAKGHMVEISSWDVSLRAFQESLQNVHFGDVAEDLTHLIVTSLDPEVRRRNCMKIFRQYFYPLVDRRAPKFKLFHLKESYRNHLKYVVLDNIASLAAHLDSNDVNEEEKGRLARRWESALTEAEDLHTGSFISDDEQCFFAD